MAIKVNSTTVIDNDRKGTLEGIDLSGLLAEEFKSNTTFASDPNIDLAEGMLHYYQSAESSTATPNIRFDASTSLNCVLPVGKAVTVTVIITASAGRYLTGITIDSGAITVNWVNLPRHPCFYWR